MVKDTVYRHVKEYYKTNSSTSAPVSAQEVVQQDAEPEPEKADEEIKDETGPVDDPLSEWDGAAIATCDDLVYRLTVSNPTE